jgi:hypothetical protein
MSIEDNHRWPRPNHNYVPEYQMSGIPYAETKACNSTTIHFDFDYVTRWIMVSADKDIQLGFNDNDAINNSYYFSIPAGTVTQRLEIKCKKIVIKSTQNANVSVLAGLTNVAANTFPNQTNANGFKVQ